MGVVIKSAESGMGSNEEEVYCSPWHSLTCGYFQLWALFAYVTSEVLLCGNTTIHKWTFHSGYNHLVW